ncbi:succinyldiaminopimelate transaminase [Actinomadura kijaniata]|uniref:Aminotransferase n=1 Tax=Actinomadura namibiensis TaxID=182080 RepID=A0A7W3LIG8_ACTNM|nr:succinyldiaminopimelate transaminase [Actinomadura namibiensis]MBA8948683.1 succinyldiaminopimelate transaminase [Actinomadura namibiensis]
MFTLPDFPWDRLQPYRERAAAHPDGVVDLSVGTPVDPTPAPIREALAAAADAPGYPATYGTPALREAVAGWLRRRHGVAGADPDAVLPVIGTKELVAWLPTLLGAGPGDRVVFPELAYPTYDVGARLAGAEPVAADGLLSLGPAVPRIIWVNSPSNPTGRVLPAEHLRKVVAWARERGAVVVSDECYLEFGWDPGREPVSILHPDVCEGSHAGLLAVNSLSKRSNLAGYRAGIVTGDLEIIKRLLEVRKHAGMIVPAPVQAAMTVAFDDDAHVAEQRERYARRRSALLAAFERHGFRIEHSEAGLYLWATRDEPCWDTVGHLADLGITVGPGDFYGPAGARHVRIALTATDERVAAAVARL